jgi:hypothetical protein
LLDATRVRQLAVDNAIGKTTAYVRLHEGIDVLAAQAPNLHGALLAAKTAGYSHVNIDGTLIEADRVAAPGPAEGVDLWWSGKHHTHGGNVQVITVPDGWPIWTSQVRPGREHDTTAVRVHTEILPFIQGSGLPRCSIPATGRARTVREHGRPRHLRGRRSAHRTRRGRPQQRRACSFPSRKSVRAIEQYSLGIQRTSRHRQELPESPPIGHS